MFENSAEPCSCLLLHDNKNFTQKQLKYMNDLVRALFSLL